jgi:hypothetical protein
MPPGTREGGAGRSREAERAGGTPGEIVDRCAALFLEGKPGEVLALAEPQLARAAAPEWAGAPGVALACLTEVARWEQDGPDAARTGLLRAAALASAPPAEGCPPRTAALSLAVARRLLEAPGGDAEIQALRARLARFWLRWRLLAAPGDPDAEVLLETAAGALASTAGEQVAGWLRAKDWAAARRAADEAASRGDVDEARAAVLDRVILSAVKREVERLVTPAIRGARDEPRAVNALEDAGRLVASLPGGVLPARQRAALCRRVAWGHARLGISRVRTGNLGAGLDALAQALASKGLGPERLRRVRETVVEALDGLAMRAAGGPGGPPGSEDAAALARELEQQIGRARALGVPRRLLASVEERAARLAGARAGDAGS